MTVDYSDYTDRSALAASGGAARAETPIVPKGSIAGHALVAVVAIMTFLAALTTGSVVLVLSAASDWQSEVAREMTIQVRPTTGRDIEADVAKAAEIARTVPGIADIRPYTKEESARLLEPWLGSGLAIADLPVPRMIVLKIAPGQTPELSNLRQTLADRVPGASVDDHRGWVDRMRTMADTAVAVGLAILTLVLTATVLSVTFATRGAMATNRPVVEVLHFFGARDSYIAAQFQQHFLVLGLKGGAIGGGAALILFTLAGLFGDRFLGSATADQMAALFGSFSIGATGYAAVVVQIFLIAGVTAWTSRRVVKQNLAAVN